jgi:hypothetical protein
MADVSIVLGTPKWRENPVFVETAVALEAFISCEQSVPVECARVIGVGVSRDQAIDDIHENKTGTFIEGQGWRCVEHTPAEDAK